ncbi:hypothetical protein Scep_015636 [Stephania cephalantha]|uniref:Ubiquitin-like domain-containing protein n=1 Tax=Stephania cephalantha TaxID=152367 RepID=A0AAP0P300_9MAGN
MEIQVTNLKGRRIKIELDGLDSLDDLKNKILDKEGVPLDNQRFVYGGVQLDDDGFVLDQIKAIQNKNFPNERFSSSTFVNLHLIIRLRGGGNRIYHRPQGSSLSDQSSDSDSDFVVRRKGPKNAAFNGVDAIWRKQVASETRIHDLPTLSYAEGGVEGLLDSLMTNLKKGTDEDDADLSSGNEPISDLRRKEEYKVWGFLPGAGLSANFFILMVAAAAFLVPRALTKEFKVGVDIGGSVGAFTVILAMVAAAFVFLAVRHGRLSLMLRRLRDDEQNTRLERANQTLKTIDSILETQGRINKALEVIDGVLERQGQVISWTQEEWLTRMEMLRLILGGTKRKGALETVI